MGENFIIRITVGDFVNGPCDSVQVHVMDEERQKTVLHRLYGIGDLAAARETSDEISRLVREAIVAETMRHTRRKQV